MKVIVSGLVQTLDPFPLGPLRSWHGAEGSLDDHGRLLVIESDGPLLTPAPSPLGAASPLAGAGGGGGTT